MDPHDNFYGQDHGPGMPPPPPIPPAPPANPPYEAPVYKPEDAKDEDIFHLLDPSLTGYWDQDNEDDKNNDREDDLEKRRKKADLEYGGPTIRGQNRAALGIPDSLFNISYALGETAVDFIKGSISYATSEAQLRNYEQAYQKVLKKPEDYAVYKVEGNIFDAQTTAKIIKDKTGIDVDVLQTLDNTFVTDKRNHEKIDAALKDIEENLGKYAAKYGEMQEQDAEKADDTAPVIDDDKTAERDEREPSAGPETETKPAEPEKVSKEVENELDGICDDLSDAKSSKDGIDANKLQSLGSFKRVKGGFESTKDPSVFIPEPDKSGTYYNREAGIVAAFMGDVGISKVGADQWEKIFKERQEAFKNDPESAFNKEFDNHVYHLTIGGDMVDENGNVTKIYEPKGTLTMPDAEQEQDAERADDTAVIAGYDETYVIGDNNVPDHQKSDEDDAHSEEPIEEDRKPSIKTKTPKVVVEEKVSEEVEEELDRIYDKLEEEKEKTDQAKSQDSDQEVDDLINELDEESRRNRKEGDSRFSEQRRSNAGPEVTDDEDQRPHERQNPSDEQSPKKSDKKEDHKSSPSAGVGTYGKNLNALSGNKNVIGGDQEDGNRIKTAPKNIKTYNADIRTRDGRQAVFSASQVKIESDPSYRRDIGRDARLGLTKLNVAVLSAGATLAASAGRDDPQLNELKRNLHHVQLMTGIGGGLRNKMYARAAGKSADKHLASLDADTRNAIAKYAQRGEGTNDRTKLINRARRNGTIKSGINGKWNIQIDRLSYDVFGPNATKAQKKALKKQLKLDERRRKYEQNAKNKSGMLRKELLQKAESTDDGTRAMAQFGKTVKKTAKATKKTIKTTVRVAKKTADITKKVVGTAATVITGGKAKAATAAAGGSPGGKAKKDGKAAKDARKEAADRRADSRNGQESEAARAEREKDKEIEKTSLIRMSSPSVKEVAHGVKKHVNEIKGVADKLSNSKLKKKTDPVQIIKNNPFKKVYDTVKKLTDPVGMLMEKIRAMWAAMIWALTAPLRWMFTAILGLMCVCLVGYIMISSIASVGTVISMYISEATSAISDAIEGAGEAIGGAAGEVAEAAAAFINKTITPASADSIAGTVYYELRYDEISWASDIRAYGTNKNPVKIDELDYTDYKVTLEEYLNSQAGVQDYLGAYATDGTGNKGDGFKEVNGQVVQTQVWYNKPEKSGIQGPQPFKGAKLNEYKLISTVEGGNQLEIVGKPMEGWTSNAKEIISMSVVFYSQVIEELEDDDDTNWLATAWKDVKSLIHGFGQLLEDKNIPILGWLAGGTNWSYTGMMRNFAYPLATNSRLENFYLSTYIYPTKWTKWGIDHESTTQEKSDLSEDAEDFSEASQGGTKSDIRGTDEYTYGSSVTGTDREARYDLSQETKSPNAGDLVLVEGKYTGEKTDVTMGRSKSGGTGKVDTQNRMSGDSEYAGYESCGDVTEAFGKKLYEGYGCQLRYAFSQKWLGSFGTNEKGETSNELLETSKMNALHYGEADLDWNAPKEGDGEGNDPDNNDVKWEKSGQAVDADVSPFYNGDDEAQGYNEDSCLTNPLWLTDKAWNCWTLGELEDLGEGEPEERLEEADFFEQTPWGSEDSEFPRTFYSDTSEDSTKLDRFETDETGFYVYMYSEWTEIVDNSYTDENGNHVEKIDEITHYNMYRIHCTHTCTGKHEGIYCGGHAQLRTRGIVYGFSQEQITDSDPKETSGRTSTYDPKFLDPDSAEEEAELYSDAKDVYGNALKVFDASEYADIKKAGIQEEDLKYLRSARDIFDIEVLTKHNEKVYPTKNSATGPWNSWTLGNMGQAISLATQDWNDLYEVVDTQTIVGGLTGIDGNALDTDTAENVLSQLGWDKIANNLDIADEVAVAELKETRTKNSEYPIETDSGIVINNIEEEVNLINQLHHLRYAMNLVGNASYNQDMHTYLWGNLTGHQTDCSGFVSNIWRDALGLTGSTGALSTGGLYDRALANGALHELPNGTDIASSGVEPGDIILIDPEKEQTTAHALIYVGKLDENKMYINRTEGVTGSGDSRQDEGKTTAATYQEVGSTQIYTIDCSTMTITTESYWDHKPNSLAKANASDDTVWEKFMSLFKETNYEPNDQAKRVKSGNVRFAARAYMNGKKNDSQKLYYIDMDKLAEATGKYSYGENGTLTCIYGTMNGDYTNMVKVEVSETGGQPYADSANSEFATSSVSTFWSKNTSLSLLYPSLSYPSDSDTLIQVPDEVTTVRKDVVLKEEEGEEVKERKKEEIDYPPTPPSDDTGDRDPIDDEPITITGEYIWPVTTTTQSSNFGYRYHPISGTWKMHKGCDIPVGVGTKVHASAGGKVVAAGWENSNNHKQGWGLYVTIDHGNGVITRYAHLSRLNVSVGQTVKQGDIVALSGNTGSSTGPHLHFEFWKNGTPLNPSKYTSK